MRFKHIDFIIAHKLKADKNLFLDANLTQAIGKINETIITDIKRNKTNKKKIKPIAANEE